VFGVGWWNLEAYSLNRIKKKKKKKRELRDVVL